MMTDLIIRDVPDDVLVAIDARATRLGLSRAEYLRRTLVRERAAGEVSAGDLEHFADMFAHLLDDQVMRRAWD